MILFNGQILPDEKLDTVINNLLDFCIHTIESQEITASEVIEACGILSERIQNGAYDNLLKPLLTKQIISEPQLRDAVQLFRRENLEYKYKLELGSRLRCMPLGILFHLAAGNTEGLPFYTVIEGLLTGNINILKLPSKDDGLSVFLLQELIKLHPALAPFITVLDISSSNRRLLQKVGNISDAIVVWGGPSVSVGKSVFPSIMRSWRQRSQKERHSVEKV